MGLMAASCKDDDNQSISGGISVDQETITVGPEGSTEKLAVTSASAWMASASTPWIAVSPANGIGSADCSLAIDSTLENTQRTAQVRFAVDGQDPKLVSIIQFGFGKQIVLEESEVELESSDSYNNRYFEVTISTNVEIAIDLNATTYSFAEQESMTAEELADAEEEREGWLSWYSTNDSKLTINLDRKARPRTIKTRLRWETNTVSYTRVAKVHLKAASTDDQLVDDEGNNIDEVVLTVTQQPAAKITDDRAGDSIAIINMNDKLESLYSIDASENMRNWDNVTLWETTDKDIPEAAAVGRVRSVRFAMIDLQEGQSLPKEIRYLKYLESFTVQSNVNNQLRVVSLGEEICELQHLKNLTVYAYGLAEFPKNFTNLKNLETLSLASNNFAKLSDITSVVNKTNFPKLTELNLSSNRRTDVLNDLSSISNSTYNGRPIGLHSVLSDYTTPGTEEQAFLDLLTWEELTSLQLSNNFIEGRLPTDEEMDAYLGKIGRSTRYTEADFTESSEEYMTKLSKDSCQWLLTNNNAVTYTTEYTAYGTDIPRVLPRMRELRLNLNFFTDKAPKWLLYHPYFAYWYPVTLIFNQLENGKDSDGDKVQFSNVDATNFDFTYYYGNSDPGGNTKAGVAYPLYYRVFVSNSSSSSSSDESSSSSDE